MQIWKFDLFEQITDLRFSHLRALIDHQIIGSLHIDFFNLIIIIFKETYKLAFPLCILFGHKTDLDLLFALIMNKLESFNYQRPYQSLIEFSFIEIVEKKYLPHLEQMHYWIFAHNL